MSNFRPLHARVPRLGTASIALACALAGVACAQTASTAAAKDPIVISAGGEHIRASQFQALIDAAPEQSRAAMSANKRAVADELGKMLALVNDARQHGLDKDPAFQAQMMLARDNALAKAMVGKIEEQTKPSPAQEEAYYKAHTSDFQQTKLRHILIGDNESQGSPSKLTPQQALAKANQVDAKLKAGGDFAALAKADSDDPGSKDKGGELGQISPGQTVPEFEEAVNKLPIGKISDPIHTRFGYHIVEVEARTTMPFADAKQEIEQALTTQAVEKAIDAVTASAHVTVSDSYFGPAKAAPKPETPHQQ